MTDCYLMQQCVLLPSVWLLWFPSNEAAVWTPVTSFIQTPLWTLSVLNLFLFWWQPVTVEGIIHMTAWKCLPVPLPVPLLKINTKTKTVFARLSENFRLLSKESKLLVQTSEKITETETSFHIRQIMKAVDNIQSLTTLSND